MKANRIINMAKNDNIKQLKNLVRLSETIGTNELFRLRPFTDDQYLIELSDPLKEGLAQQICNELNQFLLELKEQ